MTIIGSFSQYTFFKIIFGLILSEFNLILPSHSSSGSFLSAPTLVTSHTHILKKVQFVLFIPSKVYGQTPSAIYTKEYSVLHLHLHQKSSAGQSCTSASLSEF